MEDRENEVAAVATIGAQKKMQEAEAEAEAQKGGERKREQLGWKWGKRER